MLGLAPCVPASRCGPDWSSRSLFDGLDVASRWQATRHGECMAG